MLDKKAKVLVVDDIQSNLDFVTDILKLENIKVVSTTEGSTAIKLAKEIKPDLVLLDISMPGIDGYEVCRIIKESAETHEIPIIFLTAIDEKEEIVKAFKHGAVDYIVKPFNYNELISRVKTQIDLKLKKEQLENLNGELEKKVEERTQELQETNVKLQNAMEELSILDKAKNEFIVHINHEVRTPLNGILGYINILEKDINPDSVLDGLKAIKSLVDRLIKVSELSLLFTELKMHNNNIVLKKVDFNASLVHLIESALHNQKNIEIVLENVDDELFIKSEPKLVDTCLNIVLDNAIKYSPEKEKITLTTEKKNGFIEIAFLDNGPGFSEKSLNEIFEFLCADNLIHQSHGFGVGLATARIILDILHGKISAENTTPNGAIVKLSFPEYKE